MADIVITTEDLKDPSIDDVVNLQKSLQSQSGERIENIKTPYYFNPMFYYTVATAIGALVVWRVLEPHLAAHEMQRRVEKFDSLLIMFLTAAISAYSVFGPVAAALGLSLGMVYGIVNRNLTKTLYCGLIGVGVGLGATVVTTLIAQVVYVATGVISGKMNGGDFDAPLRGFAFFIHMSGRAIAWSIISMAAGLGLGVALKSKKLMLNGFVGGMIGGLLGGMFFDPIGRFLASPGESGALSRFVGFFAVGIFVGFFIGLFENISKEAWFLMLKGPLTGKQFVLFKSPMKIGSSPKSDIYLFKDADIAPHHASITKNGSRYLLKDEGSEKGTYVNGRRVDNYVLQDSDTITIGEAVLRYSEKSKEA